MVASPELMRTMTSKPKLSQQEQQFVDYVRRLERHREGRVAIHARLSQLQPVNRQAQHIVVAQNCFNAVVNIHEGQLFRLSNTDLICVGKDVTKKVCDEVETKLSFLFRDDPFLEEAALSADEPGLCVVYDVEKDYSAFRAVANRVREMAGKMSVAVRTTPSLASEPEKTRPDAVPVTPRDLDRVEVALETLDISRFMQRNFVYAVLGDTPPEPIFAERCMSVPALQNAVAPKCDLSADPWLLRHLSSQIDVRLLQALSGFDPDPMLPDSINLSVDRALSREFMTFESRYDARSKTPLLLEFHIADIFQDMQKYEFACSFLRSRNCRVCIDEVDPAAFIAIDHATLGADFTKVLWSADWVSKVDKETQRAFADAVDKAGPARVILMNCDDPQALSFGKEMGIKIYQGPFMDGLASRGPDLAVTA